MQYHQNDQKAQVLFQQQTGVEIASMLAPIDPDWPTGVSLRDADIYSQMAEARREDDASLPQGVWECELKKADWRKVAVTAVEALQLQSKDLQLAIWLLEAQTHRFGFSGIAPCMLLISQLCQRYWESLHPQMIDGDHEYRTNLIAGINKNLPSILRLIAVTVSGDPEQEFCWADWEMAQRREAILAAHPQTSDVDDGASTEDIRRAIISTSNEFYVQLADDLEQAISETEGMVAIIDSYCGQDAPSLAGFTGVLNKIRDMVCEQLDQRGVDVSNTPASAEPETASAEPGSTTLHRPSSMIANRIEAYAHLRQVAEFLAVDDPHSPVPYLVMKAVEWGSLNTAELYHQIFVQQQGQLNIFDVLGLDQTQESSPSGNGIRSNGSNGTNS